MKLKIAFVGIAIGIFILVTNYILLNRSSKMSIQKAKKKAEKSLMPIDGVVGIGIGESKGKKIINIYVKEKNPELLEKLPDKVKDYKTRIIESGKFRVL